MKFCPNCGKEVSPEDTFCPNCSYDLRQKTAQFEEVGEAKVPESKPNQQPVSEKTALKKGPDPAPQPISRSERNHSSSHKKRNIIFAICGLIIVVAVVLFAFNTFKSSKNAKNNSASLTPTEQVATIVSYGHLNYGDNQGWGEAYHDAENNKLKVKRYSGYNFGEYEATVPKSGALYVLNKHVGYVLTKPDDFKNSEIIFVGDDGRETSVTTEEVIKKVNNSYKDSVIKKLAHGIAIDENVHAKPEVKSTTPAAKKSSEEKKTTKKTTKPATVNRWTQAQNTALKNYMAEFGTKMRQNYDQSYTKYDQSTPIKTIAGENYPAIFKQAPFKLFSDADPEGTKIDIGWDPDFSGKYAWQVFAIYNANIGAPEQHVTYIFCYHDGHYYALVDQTTNGGIVMVKQTANKYLLNAYNQITN